jgi:hypothetical protein
LNQQTDATVKPDLLERYRRAALKRLDATGSIETGCGSFDTDGQAISFATDPGYETFNDDFIAFWKPKSAGELSWVAAVADGVTGSLLAREAAELASYFGLVAVGKSDLNPSAISKNPIAYVTRVFHQIGRQVQAESDGLRPDDCPNAIWKVAVREGKFLQTTLTLIWSTSEGLRVMAVGDGGILYSYLNTPTELTPHTFGTGKLQCLGPFSAPVQPEAYLLENWNSVTCYTDGLAESVEQVAELPAMVSDGKQSIASVIEYLNGDHPELVDDNLSAFRCARK